MSADDSQEPEIRFDDETTQTAAPPTCSVCHSQITTEYFLANNTVVCATCRQSIETAARAGSGTSRFTRALGLGVAAAAVGAGIYFAILRLTGYEIGLVAVVVGFLVGGAVRRGSQERGGWVYQTLAVVLTYFAIVTTYIPFILQGFRDEFAKPRMQPDSAMVAAADSAQLNGTMDSMQLALNMSDSSPSDASTDDGPVTIGTLLLAWVVLFLVAAASPILAGLQNIIGMLIIGFALYQAWTMNRRRTVSLTGPFTISTEPSVALSD
jgi:hypothetical protein